LKVKVQSGINFLDWTRLLERVWDFGLIEAKLAVVVGFYGENFNEK
jgi:hypothetical protein